MIQAMADRKETVVLSAVLEAAGRGPRQFACRPSAYSRVWVMFRALSALLKAAVDADTDLAQAAKAALAGLPGEKVDAQIVALLPKAQGKSYPLLIELVGQRRIDATADLLQGAGPSRHRSAGRADLAALGETVALKGLSVLVSQVLAPKHAEDAPVAQQALKAASVRMPDREACATELAAPDRHRWRRKARLLEILSDVEGTKARK